MPLCFIEPGNAQSLSIRGQSSSRPVNLAALVGSGFDCVQAVCGQPLGELSADVQTMCLAEREPRNPQR
jgi:hypothetical protein